MQKKTFSIAIGIVIALLLFLNAFTYVILTRSPKVYDITVGTEDLTLEDFNLVEFNNYLYVDKGSYLEKKDNNKTISHIVIEGIIGESSVNFSTDESLVNDRYYLNINKIIKSKVDKDTALKISIKYVSDGVQKEFHNDIKIIDYRVKNI